MSIASNRDRAIISRQFWTVHALIMSGLAGATNTKQPPRVMAQMDKVVRWLNECSKDVQPMGNGSRADKLFKAGLDAARDAIMDRKPSVSAYLHCCGDHIINCWAALRPGEKPRQWQYLDSTLYTLAGMLQDKGTFEEDGTNLYLATHDAIWSN